MARTYGENMADSERREEEVSWKKRMYNVLETLNVLNKDNKELFEEYMLKLEGLIAEGIEEQYSFPTFSDENLQVALKNYSLKQLSS